MRGLIERELPFESPYPLGLMLPALYHEDDLAQRFTAALDDVLLPVLVTLDSLEAYIDPDLTPADFLEWLGSWVGMAIDETWPLERQRAVVAQAVELYRWRGTIRGIRALVAVFTGIEPEIGETGGVAWSGVPGGSIPGEADARMTVRVRVADPKAVDVARLDAIVAAAKPAHVAHEVEVLAA